MPTCERLVNVPYPLPGYADIIYRPCGREAVGTLPNGKAVCAEHQEVSRG